MIEAILKSRTAHAMYGNLSVKKRREWIYNLANDLSSTQDKGHMMPQIKQAYFKELSM